MSYFSIFSKVLKNFKNISNFKTAISLIFNYNICKKYFELVQDINNHNLKCEIVKDLYLRKKSPSDYSFFFNNLHSDIEYERFSIFTKSTEIRSKLEKLNSENKYFFKKKFSKFKKKIKFFSFSPSFLAFNTNLALIYNFFGIECKIFYYHDEDNLLTKQKDKINFYKLNILKTECNKISKKYKNIKFIFLSDYRSKNKLSKEIKEEIKLISIKDITSYNQILNFNKKFKYSLFKDKIIEKFRLKPRYIINLNFAKRISNFLSQDDFWIIHNSNLGLNGVLQKIINERNLKYTSHEFRVRSFDNRKKFENFTPIIISKNKEVLKFEISKNAKQLVKENDIKKINFGANKIISNFENNYKKNEIDNFYFTYPELKNYEKKKIFLLFSNVLFESRYTMNENHTIFKSLREFISDTISFFNNSDLKLVIKGHPTELALKDKFNENLETIVKSLPQKNIYLIYGNQISSYSLMGITNNIIVYDTDMGAEANFMDKYVISCGKPRYKDFDITYFPHDRLDYLNTLKNFDLEKNEDMKNKFKLSKDRSSLFWYFHCLELFKSFPFVYGDSNNQLNKNFKFFFSSECDESIKNLLFDLIDC